jgi:hypothetical protein
VKEVVESIYNPTPRYVLRGISVTETIDSLFVGAHVTQFTHAPLPPPHTHTLNIHIIPTGTVTELNFVYLSTLHVRIQDHVTPHNEGVSFGRNSCVIYA